MTIQTPWLTVKEAAAHVRLCESAFRKAVKAGRMPQGRAPTVGGRRKLWQAAELDAAREAPKEYLTLNEAAAAVDEPVRLFLRGVDLGRWPLSHGQLKWKREPILALRDARRSAQRSHSLNSAVYFIGCEGVPRLKVGFSGSPGVRVADLQVGSPVRLEVIAAYYGTRDDEARLHHLLAEFRAHGEWFHRTKAVDRFVEHLQEVHPSPLHHIGPTLIGWRSL